jgi:hypothetical protein
MGKTTRVLVYEYLRQFAGEPVTASEIAEFYRIREGAVSVELNRLEDLNAVVKHRPGLEQTFTLRDVEHLRKIKSIRTLERDLPRFASQLHGGRRLGPETQFWLRQLPRFGTTDPNF